MAGPAGTLLIVLGCLALLAALRLATRPDAAPATPSGLTAGRAALLASAVEALPAGAVVCSATVGDRDVAVRVAGAEPPPPPWRPGDDGAWAAEAGPLAVAGESGSRPGMFRVGGTHGRDVLVDLGAAPGLVAVGGDHGAARAAVLGGVRDLLARTRPASVEVTLVDGTPDDVLAGLPVPAVAVDGAVVGRVAPVRTGRLRLLVLWEPPSAATARRLTALVEDPVAGVAAICVGDTPDARWRVTLDRDGGLDLGVLGPVPQGSA